MEDKQKRENQIQVQTDDKSQKSGQQGKYNQNSYSEIMEIVDSLP